MRKLIFTLGFVALTATMASAQVRFGLYGLADFPLSDFHKTGYNNGGGFGLSVMSGSLNANTTKPDPFVNIHLGGNMDFNSFGSKTYHVLLVGGDNRKADAVVSDNSFGLNLAARFVFFNAPIRPYLEAFTGLRTFGTDETITPTNYNQNYEDQTNNNIINRATFSYGLSAGVLWRLNSWMDLETGVIFSKGTYAQYQLMDKIEQVGNEIHYEYDGSNTNLFQVKAGLVFRLQHCEGSCCQHSEYSHTQTIYTPPHQQPNIIRPNPKPGF